MKSHVHSATRFVERAGEAMKNSAEAARLPVLFENREAVVPRIAAMNHDRALRGARLLELPPEDALLHVPRRVIVVVIEAHFAPARSRADAGQLSSCAKCSSVAALASCGWMPTVA